MEVVPVVVASNWSLLCTPGAPTPTAILAPDSQQKIRNSSVCQITAGGKLWSRTEDCGQPVMGDSNTASQSSGSKEKISKWKLYKTQIKRLKESSKPEVLTSAKGGVLIKTDDFATDPGR